MILIVNRGACPRRAIELIGHTSKDGLTTVGRFGSGTAYAVALALRQGLEVTISSHDEDGPYEVQPYIKEVTVGDAKARQVIWRYRRGSSLFKSWWESPLKALSRAWSVPTSFSVELGHKDWHGAFPVVREFVSNARDADPEHFACWVNDDANETHLEMYLSRAKSEGHSAVTVVRIDNPLNNADAPEKYVEDWSNNFRWEPYHNGDNCGEVFRTGLEAIYRKPSPSPLKLFVRGVRCPWPGMAPVSMYDYSLDLILTEARTIASEGLTSTFMTRLWTKVPRALMSEMMLRLPSAKETWESEMCNPFVMSHEVSNPMSAAWREAFGDAPVSGPSDPPVPGAVMVSQPVRDFLAHNNIPTSQSRTVVVPVFDTKSGGALAPAVMAPTAVDQLVVALNMPEAHRLLWLLDQYEPRENDPVSFDALRDRLRKAGARPEAYEPSVDETPTDEVFETLPSPSPDKDFPF